MSNWEILLHMVRSVILGTSRGVNTSCVCNGDNILKIMHDVFHFSLGNPIPQPSSADGMGQEEVQVSVKGWSDRTREQRATHLFWTLRDCWRKEKGDTFRTGLRGRVGVRLPSWVRMLLKCPDEPQNAEAHRPLGRLPAALDGGGGGRPGPPALAALARPACVCKFQRPHGCCWRRGQWAEPLVTRRGLLQPRHLQLERRGPAAHPQRLEGPRRSPAVTWRGNSPGHRQCVRALPGPR